MVKLTKRLQDELHLALEKSSELRDVSNQKQYIDNFNEATTDHFHDDVIINLSSSRSTRSRTTRSRQKATNEEANSFLIAGFQATVLFAQYECGSGICIHNSRSDDSSCADKKIILTCAHCLGDHPKKGTKKVLVFTDGTIVMTNSVRVDIQADIALMQIVGFYNYETASMEYDQANVSLLIEASLTSVSVSTTNKILKMEKLFCVGQPGRDDLESKSARKTNYDVVSTSTGCYEKCLPGDVNDNSEIGKLQHDCWTYWGHSGAALLNSKCEVLGLHSSWDDELGTRHGVHLNAIQNFLRN